jgi:rhodanese-related sulfurtransferase
VNVTTAKHLLAEGNSVVVDTREEGQCAAGHSIDNAWLLNRGVLEFQFGGVVGLTDKFKAALIYCRTGGRSAPAAQTMQQLDDKNVLSMAGGFYQKAERIKVQGLRVLS